MPVEYLKTHPWSWHTYNGVAKALNQSDRWKESYQVLTKLVRDDESKVVSDISGKRFRFAPVRLGGERKAVERRYYIAVTIILMLRDKPGLGLKEIRDAIRDLRGKASNSEVDQIVRTLDTAGYLLVTSGGNCSKSSYRATNKTILKSELLKQVAENLAETQNRPCRNQEKPCRNLANNLAEIEDWP